MRIEVPDPFSSGQGFRQQADVPESIVLPPPDEDYSLPFFGAEARKTGADLPLPVGISVIGQYQRESIRAHNLQVGLGNGALIDASFVGFNSIITRVRNLLFRGDLWLFPFLNIYGIAGESWSATDTSLFRPLNLDLTTNSNGVTLGFGGTLAYGIEPFGFITLDANLTWADQSILTNPQRTLTVTPRIGHRWLSELHPGRAFSVWVGASMEEFENASVGQVPFSLGSGPGGSLPLPSDFGSWLAGLPATQRASVGQLLSELIMLEQGNGQSTAAFNLNINPNKAWNMVLGGEMDLNKHWQLIAEAGLLGSRTTVAGNLCYRFGI